MGSKDDQGRRQGRDEDGQEDSGERVGEGLMAFAEDWPGSVAYWCGLVCLPA